MIRAEQTKRNRQLTLVRSKQNETKKIVLLMMLLLVNVMCECSHLGVNRCALRVSWSFKAFFETCPYYDIVRTLQLGPWV